MSAEDEPVGDVTEPIDLHALEAHQRARGLGVTGDGEDDAREPPRDILLTQAALHAHHGAHRGVRIREIRQRASGATGSLGLGRRRCDREPDARGRSTDQTLAAAERPSRRIILHGVPLKRTKKTGAARILPAAPASLSLDQNLYDTRRPKVRGRGSSAKTPVGIARPKAAIGLRRFAGSAPAVPTRTAVRTSA